MRESMGSTKPKGGMKVKAVSHGLGGIPWLGWGRTTGPSGRLPPVRSGVLEVRRSKSVHVGTRKMVNYA